MIIELSSLDETPRSFEFTIAGEELDLEVEGASVVGQVAARGEIAKRIAQTDISGHIDATTVMDCVRCLQPVERPVAIDFELTYVDPEHFSADRETEVAAADLETDVLQSDTIDIKEVVREQILLDMPAQVFCRDDCKGLCSKCGGNLNLVSCNCRDEEIDPRWSALKNLN